MLFYNITSLFVPRLDFFFFGLRYDTFFHLLEQGVLFGNYPLKKKKTYSKVQQFYVTNIFFSLLNLLLFQQYE